MDQNIENQLTNAANGDVEAIIYLGEIVERTIHSEFGTILKALTTGKISDELLRNADGQLPADRVLGRVEMANNLWDALEQFVLDKDKLMEHKPIEPIGDTQFSEEPTPQQV